ncbi:MAG: hypothetical protein MKZ95_13760 [Pirellulales bacterium]|nr:hypothetical protein [Pirellulales bacterium]
MGGDHPTTKNEEAMIKIGPDVIPPPSRQARIQQYYCELPDAELKFVDLVLCFQDEAISAVEPASS